MNKCNDYWCEYYGKANEKCDHCEKKENAKDKPDVRAMLKRRAVDQVKLAKKRDNSKGITRQ